MFNVILPEDEAIETGFTTIPVELGICFTGNVWSRAIVFIPKDTRPCNIEKVSRAMYMKMDDSMRMIEHIWVQCYGDELRGQIH